MDFVFKYLKFKQRNLFKLKATPFPGLSPEEVKWAASLKSREEAKRNEAQMMEEKAKILDDNETVRKEAWKEKELINS